MQIGIRLLKISNEEITIREIYPELKNITIDLEIISMFKNIEIATVVGFLETIFTHLKDKTEYVNILPKTFNSLGITSQKFYRCMQDYMNSFPKEYCEFEKIRIDNKSYFKLNLKEGTTND